MCIRDRDYTVMEKMLKYFISKAMGRHAFRKPRISICIPSGTTEIERKAVEEATYQAGAREVFLVEEPIAAAIGAGVDAVSYTHLPRIRFLIWSGQ